MCAEGVGTEPGQLSGDSDGRIDGRIQKFGKFEFDQRRLDYFEGIPRSRKSETRKITYKLQFTIDYF